MKKFDGMASSEYGISSLVLMERAALETARVIEERFGRDIRVGVMAGSGNNGGDGIAVARILHEGGTRVEINFIGDEDKLSPQTKQQLETARKLGLPVYAGIKHTGYDVIVDAVFGIGLTRDIEGKYKDAVEVINNSAAKVVSVDIPSGINADDARVMGCAVKADITVTFQYRKFGIILYPGAEYAGEVICVPIGIPKELTDNRRTGAVTFTDKESDLRLPERKPSGNKGTFGKVLFIAGSKSMGGACQLSALSAYRIGAGMVRVFTASENRESLLRKLPEAIVDTYCDDGESSLLEAEAQALAKGIEWADVVAVGPGLSVSGKAEKIMEIVLDINTKNMVIDADALNILSQKEELLEQFEFDRRKSEYEVVMTPHMGEFSRLIRKPVTEIKKDIIAECKAFTKKYDVSLVCKDARTVVTKRGKLTYINTSGNDGMATAGSGDVLTGIIAGLLAQKPVGFEAAVMGTYAHGIAGDIAGMTASSYYIMAQDIIQALKCL